MMANLVKLVWLSLIWTLLIGSAAAADEEEWKYLRCAPEPPYEIWSDLNTKLAQFGPKGVSIESLRMVLNESKDMMFGNLKAEELLALAEVSEDKCNLAEFARRYDYEEIYSKSPVIEYIRHYNEELKALCKGCLGKEFSQEFIEATKIDESIIKAVIEKNDRESSDFAVNLKVASDKYVESLAGKQNFVREARQLRILHACNNLAKFISIAKKASFIVQEASDMGPVCMSLRKNFRKYSRSKRILKAVAHYARRALIIAAISGTAITVISTGIISSTLLGPVTSGTYTFVAPYMPA